MCSIKRYEKWLLIKKANGNREIVNVRSLLNSAEEELALGSRVTLAVCDDEDKSATIIAAARDPEKLEKILSRMLVEKPGEEEKLAPDQEGNGDFSPSEDSSWEPSANSSSSEGSDTDKKDASIMQQHHRSSRVLTPCTRVNAIIPNAIPTKKDQSSNGTVDGIKQNLSDIIVTKVKNEINQSGVSKTPQTPFRTTKLKYGQIYHRANSKASQQKADNNESVYQKTNDNNRHEEVGIINNLFFKIFKLINDVKAKHSDIPQNNINSTIPVLNGNYNLNESSINSSYQNISNIDVIQDNFKEEESTMMDHMSEDDYDRSDDSNRSDDNVLISNKYDIVESTNVDMGHINDSQTNSNKAKSNEEEWVAIGSGQTLVHKDKFKTVNWRSYTMATRTLLLAVFPRHILATHSLTGKKSPAFLNKPAKMCLDPRIIQDVIYEIKERFHIKENLIRTIITTKCADECKMMKLKKEKIQKIKELKNKNKRMKLSNKEDVNQTC